ncbi:hypothetical protein [Natronoglycomyces albus]|uniref:Uncharacterized protein n=1 Tax=Natronoglycomyces albus TaxID=2811108 RepID=A0A895XU24_9ACTN|nr:hypothetical protein [Natronoglycomyces albus]QSB07172.1 hypothetical protein JQS30_17165 [Natronoglycomyces albus]
MNQVGPTPGITDTDQQPIDRDDYAAFLNSWLESTDPAKEGHGSDLDRREDFVAASLLDVLSATYQGEDLGRFARLMAVRLYDRLGL